MVHAGLKSEVNGVAKFFAVIPIFGMFVDGGRKSPDNHRRLVPQRGTSAVVTNVGTGCGGRGSTIDEWCWRVR
jgi:hypothetical protein